MTGTENHSRRCDSVAAAVRVDRAALKFRSWQRFGERRDAGFTYVGLLVLLAIMGIVSAMALQLGKVTYRRAAEESLLDVGTEFSQALESYRRATPAGQPDEPRELQDLLRDPRFPGTKRHLRKLYDDPLTGKPEWGLQKSEESKRIVGVYSLSDARPIKVGNFELRFQAFEGKPSYQLWVFTSAQAETAAGAASSAGLVSPQHLMDDPDATPAKEPPPRSTDKPSGLISPMDLL